MPLGGPGETGLNIDEFKSGTSQENSNPSVLGDKKLVRTVFPVEIGPKEVFGEYPTSQSVEIGARTMSPADIRQKALTLVMHKDQNLNLLDLHGVTNSSQVQAVLCPEGQSLVYSLASQSAYLVTDDFRIVDVAAHPWPIDLKSARDVRATIAQPVRFGDRLGVVASDIGDEVVMVQSEKAFMVSINDLEPVMVQQDQSPGGDK
jgi:hypothetical protein